MRPIRQLHSPAAATALALAMTAAVAQCHWVHAPPHIRELHACAGVALGAIAGPAPAYHDANDAWDAQTQTLTTTLDVFRDGGDPTPAGTIEVSCAWRPGTLDEDQFPIADPQIVTIDGHRVRRGERYDLASKEWRRAKPAPSGTN